MTRRFPLEDKLIASTLVVVGIVMAGVTATLLTVIRSRFPPDADDSFMPLLMLGVVTVMVACYAVTMVVLWLLVRWMVIRPTRRLLEATKTVAAGSLDYRAEPLSTDELGELTESFNSMTAKLDESFQSIERLSQFNALVLDRMSSGLIAVDSAGRIRMANRAACAITGLDSNELTGTSVTECGSIKPLADLVTQAIYSRQPVERVEVRLTDAAEREAVLGVSVSLLAEDGGAVAVFADLTESKRLEREAQLRREMAALGELTAGVVHEIRSPLSVISATAQLMLRQVSPEHKMHDTATSILDEVAELEKTVAGLLMFARPLELDFKQIPLDEVIERAAALCRPRIDKRGIRLELDLPATMPLVRADFQRLAQAIANLINNSVDALDTGGTIRVTANDNGPERVDVSISDDGPGVPPQIRPRLFEPFFTQKEGGTGLGLSIVHKVITAHDGGIELMPTPSGATFQITLPTVEAAETGDDSER